MIITGELKNQIDKIWDDMYSYGIANPLVVIEQLTYLIFIKSLDEVETANEKKDEMLGITGERIFEPDEYGQRLRWSMFCDLKAEDIFSRLRDEVFPFIKGTDRRITLPDGTHHSVAGLKIKKKSAYAKYMRDANFLLPNALITQKVITAISALPVKGSNDQKGDVYEYMISKLQTAGRIGQFRTPRHIIKMMVRMINPQITDVIADPACGTGGFLVVAGQYVRQHNAEKLRLDKKAREHYQSRMFTGYDTDQTMLRITAMNTILHGMENANIRFNDSLSKDNTDTELYSVILANPPFKGSLDHDSVAPSLTSVTDTGKTELLFVALFLRMLEAGGRCACIVPDGVVSNGNKAYVDIRKELIERHKLQAVISMPNGVFKPYAGVSTAVLVFTKTGTGGTDNVWFYEMRSDGFSLDDKRVDLGDGGDIDDIVARYASLRTNPELETARDRTAQSFLVPKQELIDNGYDLTFNKYKKTESAAAQYPPALEILAKLRALEQEAADTLSSLEELL